MDIKDQILEFFDQNPESAPEDFVTLNPEVLLPTVESYWALWKKMSAWRFSQGLVDENLSKKAPRGKKKKALIKEQKIPVSGLGVSNTQIQQEVGLQSGSPSAQTSPSSISDIRQIELMNYLLNNQEVLVRILEHAKYEGLRSTAQDLTEGLDSEMIKLFDESCGKMGLTRNQGLNLALRDFIQKN